MTEENRQLRTTFDQVALLYDQARPGYPEELFDRKTRRKPLALDMGISRQGLLSPVKRLSGFSHSDII
ncbi:hypothetical protein SAMD00079811_40980 [Scytonema sp. HK-05]|nr:hypothetical protein SAMD00079811_40980 [Scytonema sp. HK-05]